MARSVENKVNQEGGRKDDKSIKDLSLHVRLHGPVGNGQGGGEGGFT